MTEQLIPEGLDIEHWPEFLALAERLMLTQISKQRSIKIQISGVVEVSHNYLSSPQQVEEIPEGRDLYGKFN